MAPLAVRVVLLPAHREGVPLTVIDGVPLIVTVTVLESLQPVADVPTTL